MMNDLNRRDFIKNLSIAGSGMLALQGLSADAWKAPTNSVMPMSLLGKTGAKVSKLGLGTHSLAMKSCSNQEAQRIFAKAIDQGINYIDTAPNYHAGESERRTGQALKGKRDKAFVVTKTEDATYEGTMKLLEESLKNLKTDHVDLVHLHNLGHQKRWEDLDFAFSDKGAMGALREARKKGMVRFIGASGHIYPSRFKYAIDSGEIEALMLAVNYVNQHTYDFENKVWVPAAKKNIGLCSMKVFGGVNHKTKECRLPMEDYENAFRYTLSLKGLNTAVVGIGKTAHLDQLLSTFRRVDALNEQELLALAEHGRELIEKNKSFGALHGQPLS